MKSKILITFLVTLLFFQIKAKRIKQNRVQNNEVEETTLQPSVVTYSTFGYNNFDTYDGFVPSSPDYTKRLISQEPPARLYAPAFPTASDLTSPSDQSKIAQVFTSPDTNEENLQSNKMHYQSNLIDYFKTTPFSSVSQQNSDNLNSQMYGVKLISKTKNKTYGFYNTDHGINNETPPEHIKNDHTNLNEVLEHGNQNLKPVNSGVNSNKQFNFNYLQYHPEAATTNISEPEPTRTSHPLKLSKVLDSIKIKQHNPIEENTNVHTYSNSNSYVQIQRPVTKVLNQNIKFHNGDDVGSPTSSHNNFPNIINYDEKTKNLDMTSPIIYSSHNMPETFPYTDENVYKKKNVRYNEITDNKISNLPEEEDNNFNSLKKPYNGYAYATDTSNISFQNYEEPSKFTYFKHLPLDSKKRFNKNEADVVAASSHVTNYKYPDMNVSGLKKLPNVKSYYDSDIENARENYKTDEDFIIDVKDLYALTPGIPTQRGSDYRSNVYNGLRNHAINTEFDEDVDDIVHIPKKQKFSFGEYDSTKPNEWALKTKYKYKNQYFGNDWNKEILSKFKSEEDLLRIRNQDTVSLPSYLASYKPIKDESSREDYKKLVDEWRQSYVRGKYSDTFRDYESYPTLSKYYKSYSDSVPVAKHYPRAGSHSKIVEQYSRLPDDIDGADDDALEYRPASAGSSEYRESKKYKPYLKKPHSSRYRSRTPATTRIIRHETGDKTYVRSKRRRPTKRPQSSLSENKKKRYYGKSKTATRTANRILPERINVYEEYEDGSDYYKCKTTGSCW